MAVLERTVMDLEQEMSLLFDFIDERCGEPHDRRAEEFITGIARQGKRTVQCPSFGENDVDSLLVILLEKEFQNIAMSERIGRCVEVCPIIHEEFR